MASELGLPPPAKIPSPAPTTVTDIGDDLLREIFLRLPSLPSLVRAALACPTFLHAVRSSPAFRRLFQSLHPPQILGFFIDPSRPAFPTFAPFRRRSDPDLAAAIRNADFFLTRLPEDSADSGSGWEIASCHGGYVVLLNFTTSRVAAYNPLTQALDIFPMPPDVPPEEILHSLEFHIVISEEDQGVFRMVGIQHLNTPQQLSSAITVFSSTTREWKVLPWVEPPQPEDDGAPHMPPQPEDDLAPPMPPQPEDAGDDVLSFYPGTRLNELVYWKHMSQGYALILNTATLQFSRVDFPEPFQGIDSKPYWLGQTKDGKLFMVGTDISTDPGGALFVCFRKANDDGVAKWEMGKIFPLGTIVDATEEGIETMQVEAVIDGYVYLSAKYVEQPESLISFCLETGKPNKLFDDTYTSPAHPYIMAWPPFLCNKVRPCLKIPEDSQTKVTGDSVADVGPVGTKESPSALDVKNSLA